MRLKRTGGPAKTTTPKIHHNVQQYYNSNLENSLANRTREALADMGIVYDGPLPDIGNVRLPGFQKKTSNKACSVTLLDNVAFITDFSTGNKRTVFARSLQYKKNSPIELKKNRFKIERLRKTRDLDQENAALEARKIWNESTNAPVSGYLLKKGLSKTHSARWSIRHKHWTIALMDIEGVIHNVQRIYNHKRHGNDKWYLKGGRKSGLMAMIGTFSSESRRVCVVEGFATGATIHETTGLTVACAMDCNNLKLVCKAIKYRYPLIEIIVCGDDDRFLLKNIGREKAIEAATIVGGKVCFPRFNASCGNCIDFNDVVMCPKCGGAS